MGYNKFKDDLPENTIKKIEGILEELEIDYSLETKERVSGIFSSTLVDKEGLWNTCGKGTTELYCNASALGEAVEHLSNYTAYNMLNLSEAAKRYGGFEHYPDEYLISINELPDKCSYVFEDLRKSYMMSNGYIISDEGLCSLLKQYFGTDTMSCIPFYSIVNHSEILVPEALLSNLCGSNGGGAGNSASEAIGHGLDEITERYAKEKIYHQKLTPPDIPRSYIEQMCPELLETINKIEQGFKFNVLVKDASLGKGLPVVCVILINRRNQTYLANFGAHPRFEIALERCLTELFQAYELDEHTVQRKDMKRWNTNSDVILDSTKNWVSLLRDDIGIIPNEVFTGNPNWEFIEWEQYENYSNTVGMKSQIDRLLKMAPDILVRNNSYLGIYSYKVYIPGVSTTALPFSERHLHCFELNSHIGRWINKWDELSEDVLKDLMNNYFHPDMFMGALSFSSMREQMWNSLYAALLLRLRSEDAAIEILMSQDDLYCESAVNVIRLCQKGMDRETIKKLIKCFYTDEIREFAECWLEKNVFATLMKKYVDSNYVIKAKGIINNNQKAIDALHIRLKKFIMNHPIDQMETGYIIEGGRNERK